MMWNRQGVFFITILCTLSGSLCSVIQKNDFDYQWAEPDGPKNGLLNKMLSHETSLLRLNALRLVMANQKTPIHAYIVPTGDAHNSQYIAPSDARREWISGLSGSSGTAVVTADAALLWTDGRYYTQFEMQVDQDLWDLMRQGTDLSIQDWLTSGILEPGSVVAVDPTTYTRSSWVSLETSLTQAGLILLPTTDNLVDLARHHINDPPPARPNQDLVPLAAIYTGRHASEKIGSLMTQITARGAAALVLTALDDIAYTLNLRGSDIPYNPVFFSYLILIPGTDSTDARVVLFWNEGVLSEEVMEHLAVEGVAVEPKPYADIFNYLTDMTTTLPPGSTLWLSQDCSQAIFLAASNAGLMNTVLSLSPVSLMKCIKNEVELQGFYNSHVKDGIAVVRFLRYIHRQVDIGNVMTEMDAVEMLERYRHEEIGYKGPSFSTIAGAGENGAVIHYTPSNERPRVVRADDMFLVDSGGQYLDGTTDITRTRHMSANPTDKQRLAFTRVLQGQILMGTAVFPRGSRGNVLDTLARKGLWDVGMNYNHGTGHGVGHFLNVHEGPSGIGSGAISTDPGIQPGMIFSNEPGYYEVNEFGIRHEDLVEVIEVDTNAEHIFADGMVDDFDSQGAVGFYPISLAPYQTACLNVTLMTDHEIKYLNDYHARVLATLGPILQQRELYDDYEWLEKECARISNTGFILTAVPLLAILSLFTLWIGA